MSILLPTNFDIQSSLPIDTRLVVNLLSDRDELATAVRYWGMIVHVIDSTGANVAATYILNKFNSNDTISDNANWAALGGATAAGSTGDIQFNTGGSFSTDVGFYYDAAKDMLVAGAGTLLPDFTLAHADSGNWSMITGEDHTFLGGRSANILIAGWAHVVGDDAVGGFYAGTNSVITGSWNKVDGNYSTAMGYGLWAKGHYSYIVGSGYDFGESGKMDGLNDIYLIAGGNHSINISQIDGNHTDGYGAMGDAGGILGGLNHHIPSDSPRSFIIGGNTIIADASTPDTLFVPQIRLGKGTGATLVQNDAETQIAVIDSTTGQIKWRESSTLGGSGLPGGTLQYALQVRNAVGDGFDGLDGILGVNSTLSINSDSTHGYHIAKANGSTVLAQLNGNDGNYGHMYLNNTVTGATAVVTSNPIWSWQIPYTVIIGDGDNDPPLVTDTVVTIVGTSSITIPSGTIAERPSTGVSSMVRFNSTDSNFEGYNGSNWDNLSNGNGDTSQTIKTLKFTITKAQIQASTVVTMIPTAGAGKLHKIIGATAVYVNNGIDYVGGADLLITNTDVTWSCLGIITATTTGFNSSNFDKPTDTAGMTLDLDDVVTIESSATSTGEGADIDIYVQYVIIDTN